MRALLALLALACFICAALALLSAPETNAALHARISSCMAEHRAERRRQAEAVGLEPDLMTIPTKCSDLPLQWDGRMLSLAALLGLVGVIAMAGVGATRLPGR